ncbi:MAG TPA: hypothetical protein VK250_02165 [Nitrososphaeraceae archaeon]|nr:hypothetical protein [Nitrososphaeraceae archaeon]
MVNKQFTKEQKHMLIQCILDCDLFGFSDKEGMKYIEEKTGRPISLTSYNRYKKMALNDNTANSWIDHFGRIGFVDHYRKRINEMERLQKDTFRQLYLELNKTTEEQNKKYIISLLAEIRENNIHLSQMGMGMPIISKLKEIIQGKQQNIFDLVNKQKNNTLIPVDGKDIIDDNQEFQNNIEKSIREREERKKEIDEKFRKKMEGFVF